MPSPKRELFFRNHPVLVACSAASVGAVLGGYVMFVLFGPAPPGEATALGNATADGHPAVSASVPCDEQAWPYLSRACIEDSQSRTSRSRIVTTDRPAEQARAPAPEKRPAPPIAEVPAAPHPTATAAAGSEPQTPAENAAPASHTDGSAGVDAEEAGNAAKAKPAGEKKRVAKKAKRKPRVMSPDEEDSDFARDAAVAGDDEGRNVDRRSSRSRRAAERVVVRSDDDEDDGGSRRIVVIRRSNAPFEGGLFGGLFGQDR